MVGVRALYQRYGFGTPQSFAAVERDIAPKDARHPFCLYNLAVLVFNRVGMASNPDIAARLRQQGEQLYSEAVPGLTKLADQGDPFAQLMLGGCYESGHGGLSEDPERAYSLYLEAAKADFPIAWYNLADMLLKGKGTTRNPSAAIRLMEKAAEAGVPVAKYGLAQAYFEGNGVPKSTGKGFAYLMSAAVDHNHNLSQYELGRIYLDGKYGHGDRSAGFNYINKAISNSCGNAVAFARQSGSNVRDQTELPPVVVALLRGDGPSVSLPDAPSIGLPIVSDKSAVNVPKPKSTPVDPEAEAYRARFAKKCSEVFVRLAEALTAQINSDSPTLSGAVLKLDPAGGKAADWIETVFAPELLEAKEKASFASAIQADKLFAFSSLDLLQILPLAAEKKFSSASARLTVYLRPPSAVLLAASDAARSAFAGLQEALDERIKKSDLIRQQSNQEAGKQNYDRASELLREAMKIDLRDQDTETLNQYSKSQKKKAYKEEIGL